MIEIGISVGCFESLGLRYDVYALQQNIEIEPPRSSPLVGQPLCQIQDFYCAFSPPASVFALERDLRRCFPRLLRTVDVCIIPGTYYTFPKYDGALFLILSFPCCRW